MTTSHQPGSSEVADLLSALATQRGFLRYTVRDLDDEQAARRTTVSELCLGGLIKHVASVERNWVSFILEGPDAMRGADEAALAEREQEFRMAERDTLAGVLADYEQVADRTTKVLTGLPDLDQSQPLPPAPWFEPGARWSARHTLLHVLAETAQHAGHADIIREALDGAKTMG